MTRNVLFDVTKETVGKVAEQIAEQHQDSILVLAPISGTASTYAPSTKGKNKGYFRMKFEVWIPEDAIVGDNALNDFGIVTLMRLPKSRVADHLIRD